MRTYESTMAEIAQLEATQRSIIEKNTPTDADKDSLLKAQGEIAQLRKIADELHASELAEARSISERAIEVVTNDELKAMSEFRDRLRELRVGEELELRSWASNTGSGSYMVPQEWHNKVEEYKFEANFLRRDGAMIVRTESTHNIPVLTTLPSPTIVGENTAYTASDPTVGQVILYAYKLTDKVLVSEELLADAAYDVPGVLARAVGLGFGKAEQDYFLTGTGSSQPTGIFNKAADLTTDSQGVMTNDEVIETVYTLAPEYRAGSVWMMDNTMAYYLATKKVDVATSGTTPFAWPTLLDGANPSLLGYPVRLASAIADKGNGNKVIAFGNPANYVIGERGPMAVKRLQLNEYGDTFAFAQRIDGKPMNAAAFTVVALHA